jgi:antitoxin CptB
MGSSIEDRRRRARMRAWRRGTREMDLVLGPYADAMLPGMDEAALAGFEAVLGEADTDLTRWLIGGAAAPEGLSGEVDRIRAHVAARFGGRAPG